MVSLSGLCRYPVKSMGGEALTRSEVGAAGLPGDRSWALSDGGRGRGQNVTPRSWPMTLATWRVREPPRPGPRWRFKRLPGKRGGAMALR